MEKNNTLIERARASAINALRQPRIYRGGKQEPITAGKTVDHAAFFPRRF
jgi:hypothetical protein